MHTCSQSIEYFDLFNATIYILTAYFSKGINTFRKVQQDGNMSKHVINECRKVECEYNTHGIRGTGSEGYENNTAVIQWPENGCLHG